MTDDTRRTDVDDALTRGDDSKRSAEDAELMKAPSAKRRAELMKARSEKQEPEVMGPDR